MGRTKVYLDRGLKLPEEFLRNLGDEDLCESCALGKPTFSFSYVSQTRAEEKVDYGTSMYLAEESSLPLSRIKIGICIFSSILHHVCTLNTIQRPQTTEILFRF